MIRRTLSDGRQFEIYKRYFDESDITDLEDKYGFRSNTRYVGRLFMAFTAVFNS